MFAPTINSIAGTLPNLAKYFFRSDNGAIFLQLSEGVTAQLSINIGSQSNYRFRYNSERKLGAIDLDVNRGAPTVRFDNFDPEIFTKNFLPNIKTCRWMRMEVSNDGVNVSTNATSLKEIFSLGEVIDPLPEKLRIKLLRQAVHGLVDGNKKTTYFATPNSFQPVPQPFFTNTKTSSPQNTEDQLKIDRVLIRELVEIFWLNYAAEIARKNA